MGQGDFVRKLEMPRDPVPLEKPFGETGAKHVRMRIQVWDTPKMVVRRGEGDNRGQDGWMASLTQWT